PCVRETSQDVHALPSDHVPQRVDHGIDLVVPEMGIHRQRKNLLRLAFRHRELALAITEVGAAAHDVDRPTIANIAVDVALGQSFKLALAVALPIYQLT